MKVISLMTLLGLASAHKFHGKDLIQEQYGDITVQIEHRKMNEKYEMPERYSADSDDTLMNMLIKDGYAFSKDKGSEMKITLNCGCNCNCCFGQKEADFWELSKSCGCDCGCCNNNKF